MAIQMTAKEKLQMKAAANKAQQDRLRANMPAADPGFMERLQEEEKQRQDIANAERVRAQRSRTVEMPPIPKEPVSDRAKKMAEVRADIDTTPVQGKAGKAAQSIGLNTMASVQYLGETAKKSAENTRDFMATQEAEEYAAAVSEFNRVRKYAMEDSPEYIAAEQAMEQARARMEQASAEERSETVDPDSLGSRMMGESIRLKEEALEGTEGAGRFLAETGMSVASNLAKLPLGAAAPVLMGAEAAAGKAYELQQQGVGAGQALTRGVTSGVIEGVTEKMGLDNLFDLVKTGGKTAVKNVLKQAGVEGTEEGFSYVFNLLADKVAKDPNAQFNWDELLQSIASGAISGLFFGAAGTAVNRGQAEPGVITQTGKEKQAPREGSLHLASDGKVTLPNAEVNTENALPLPVEESEAKLPYYFTKKTDFAKLLTENPSPSFDTVRGMLMNGDLRQSFEEATGEKLPAFAEDAYPIVKDALKKLDRDPFAFENEKRESQIRELEAKLEEAEEKSQTAKGFDFVGARLTVDDTARRLREARQEYLEARTQQTRQLVDLRKKQLEAANQRKSRSSSFEDKVGGSLRAEYVTSLLKEAETKAGNLQGETVGKQAAKPLPVREIKTPETKGDRSVRQFTKEDYQKYYPNSPRAQELPLPRQESETEVAQQTPKQELKMHAEWEFEGGRVKADEELQRLQVFFDGKPSEEVRKQMRANGFLWAPSKNAWQRKLTDNAYKAASGLSILQPSSGKSVAELQREALKNYGQQKIKERMELSQAQQLPMAPETNAKASGEDGLPLPRQESLKQAHKESVGASKNLGQVEKETGLPLPTEVQGQLAQLEALTTPLDNDDYDVNVIRKYMGEDAALYWLEHKNEEAGDLETGRPKPEQSGAVTDEQGNVVGTQATEKLGVRIEGSLADMGKVQKAREAQWGLDAANKQIEKAEKDLHASAAEKRMAESVAKGIDTLDSFKYGWDGRDNRRRSVVEELSALYRLRDTYDRNAVKALGRHNKDVFIDKLNKEILNHLDKATPPGAASLHTNTWERNNLRTWGRELGTKVNEMIFDPIRRNEANRIRWLDKQADDMKILGELTDAENEAVFDMLDSGKETATYDGVRNDVVQKAADQLRVKYSQYYDAINDVLVAHGYPEIGFIKNYAPHRQPEQMQSAMSIFEKLGLSETVNELPTELAGRTDIFKPGKKWNPYFLHRTGEEAAQDAVGGFLSYLNYMSEVLYHVDDIQKVRTFGDQIRYLYGDEGLKADYDAIRADTTLNEQEKELELARIRERQTDNSKMGGYVTSLDNYANILAGKQTQLDRAVETAIGRRGLNWIQKPIQALVRSSIPGNISSAINQTVQLPWLTAEAGEGNVLQAAFELLGGKLKREGFAGQSDFITGKRGAETYNAMKDKTAGEKVLDAASIPFEAVDDATSQVIVRAFYLKNIKAGMEHDAALRMADKQAEKLVGSRMKGSKANVFSDKSLKLLTTFQLEVANQWQHLKFDLPQEYREIERTRGTAAAKAEAVKRITKGAIYTFALNSLIEQITGNKPAGFDIIGAIRDYIQAGLPDEEDEEQGFDPGAGLADLGKAAVEDLPFVGNIGAILGIGDGRLPLPTVDYETIGAGIKKRWNAETDEEKEAGNRQIGTGVLKSAATLLPMGNQIKKTIQGTSDVVRGGRYTNDGTQLMYEVEQNVPNAIRGALFGRNALPETREYWDEGKSPALSKKQTEQMQQAEAYGIDRSVYVDFINTAKTLESDKDEDGKTVDGSLARKKAELIDSLDITGEQKLQLYLDNVASDSKREDAEAMRDAGMAWDEILPALGSEKEQRAAVAASGQIGEETKREVVRSMLDEDLWEEFDRCVAAGVKTEDFVQTRDFYSTTYADKDANGKSISGSKKNKVWNFINALDATPAQKDALSVACGYDSKLNEAPWHTGKVSLPGLPLPEVSGNAERFTMPTLPTQKEEFAMPPLPLP